MNVNTSAERRFLGFDWTEWVLLLFGVTLAGMMIVVMI
jgi:hypothetical protein